MKLGKMILVVLVLLINLVVAPPTLADRPKLTKSPDYTEVTQALNDLAQAKDTPDQAGYTATELQQKLGELQLQKYILETSRSWAQCRNETGKTLAVYAHKPKKSATQVSNLYYLANGEITEDEWNCDGVYLPTGVKVAGLPGDAQQELTAPLAVKIVPGTQLVATTNLDGTLEFNVAPAKVFKAGDVNWSIPELSVAELDTKVPNAPIED